MNRFRYLIVTLVFTFSFFFIQKGQSQISKGGIPHSTVLSVPDSIRNVITLVPPSLEIIRKEDEQYPSPYRFAVNLPVDVTPENSGNWTDLPDGSRIWRMTIVAPGALAVSAYFDRFHIPEEGRLYLYNSDKTRVIGAFTEINNSPGGYFATELVTGDKITLEYDLPAGQQESPVLHVYEIAYAYRGVKGTETSDQVVGTGGSCEVNINCTEGDNWQQQKKGVVRIGVKKSGSLYWCSGSLVNNVRKNKVPYILTANHCGFYTTPADIQQWIFYFDFEYPSCDNTPSIPVPTRSLTGATMKAQGGNMSNFGSDFFLLLLNQNIPDSMDVVFNGWTRQDTISVSGVGIHHPEGDVKKISTYTTPTAPSNYNGQPELTHWKVVWAATQDGHGVTEGGSSGSPLFDSHGRITGALTGGESNCDSANLTLPDYYGKFYYSWDKNGSDSTSCLKYWLDPDNQGPMFLDEMEVKPPPVPSVTLYPTQFDKFIKFLFIGIWPSAFHITFYNIMGVIALDRELQKTGDTMEYDEVANIPSGVYIVKIRTPNLIVTRKMIKAVHTH